jgi:RNA polymerase sigma factor FliA
MQNPVIDHEQLIYSRSKANVDIDGVIRQYTPLVRRVAWHVHSRMSSAIEVEDLMQTGMVALIEAARTFEDRGISFAPYATLRVRGAMIDALRRDARMCRSGMANRRRLLAVRRVLENRFMRAPTNSEMAIAMELDIAAYHALVATTLPVRQDSIDEVYSDHEIWFADLADNAETMLEQAAQKQTLADTISKLSEREAMVLQLYFVEEMNLDEIGETLGVGAARICQIKKAALDRMRVMMADA